MGTLGVTNKIGLHGEDMIWAPPSRWVRSTRSRWRYKRMYGQDRYHAAAQGTPLLRMPSTGSLLATTLANQLTGFSFATCPWRHPPLGGLVAPRVLGLPVRALGPCEAPSFASYGVVLESAKHPRLIKAPNLLWGPNRPRVLQTLQWHWSKGVIPYEPFLGWEKKPLSFIPFLVS